MRLDSFLALNNYAQSRNKALALIEQGFVFVNGKCVTKPSQSVGETDKIELLNTETQYVARSAKKLITAKEKFNIDFSNKIAVDLGASTGGFCEVMLENGIKKIYAVDIGTNQLHPKIKADNRVVNKEHINARYVTRKDFDDDIDIITCDLSFISLSYILPAAYCSLKIGGEFICLVKPQFEAGRKFVNKNGVVKDIAVHTDVACDISCRASSLGFSVKDISFSGIAGESGNREYLLYMIKDGLSECLSRDYIYKKITEDLK